MWCWEYIQAGSKDIYFTVQKVAYDSCPPESQWWHPECEIAWKWVSKHHPDHVEWWTPGDWKRGGIVNRNN